MCVYVCASMCVSVCLLGGAPSVWCMFTLCRGSGSIATDLHSLLAVCLGATDTHHHHANNSDREGTGIHTSTHSYFHTVNSHTHTEEKVEWKWLNSEGDPQYRLSINSLITVAASGSMLLSSNRQLLLIKGLMFAHRNHQLAKRRVITGFHCAENGSM